jgi:hypothetical protein
MEPENVPSFPVWLNHASILATMSGSRNISEVDADAEDWRAGNEHDVITSATRSMITKHVIAICLFLLGIVLRFIIFPSI